MLFNLEVSKLKIKVSTIINGIHLFFIILSVIYIMLRIAMFVLVQKFDFVIISRTLEANLWDQAWTWDIIVGFIFFLASSLYFNNRILPFIVFLTTLFSCSIWIIMMMGSNTLIPIESSSLKGNYAIYKYSNPAANNGTTLVATIYKEHYPLLYKAVEETWEDYSREIDKETVTLFKEDVYEISDDGKNISYGKFKIPIE